MAGWDCSTDLYSQSGKKLQKVLSTNCDQTRKDNIISYLKMVAEKTERQRGHGGVAQPAAAPEALTRGDWLTALGTHRLQKETEGQPEDKSTERSGVHRSTAEAC